MKIYRARKLGNGVISPEMYDSPPKEMLSASRFNDSSMQVFYGAMDVDTCLAELKLTPEEVAHNVVKLATFEVVKPLRLLNLNNRSLVSEQQRWNPDNPLTDEERWNTLHFLTVPHEEYYFMSQALASYIAEKGYMGFTCASAMRFALANFEASNVVIFGSPFRDGRLALDSINQVNITRATFEFSFGPVWKE